jgi:RNA polymerase sigma-70 factor (ECF subfamily)
MRLATVTLTAPADQLLMLAVRDGEVEKLGVLFERHHRTLFNFFLRLTRERSAAEDLVQEVFIRVLKYRHTYRGDSQFLTWAYQIARRAHIDWLRKKKPEAQWDDDRPEPASLETPVSERLREGQEQELLKVAFARLPEDRREILVLTRYQEMEYDEVAKVLGCNVGAVKTRVHRATRDLAEIFTRLSKVSRR